MIGRSLGPYQVVAKLGEGGMGEVYRATDTNLKRQVAIKVLPASVAADADRLARFQREAEVLAALNHPNIAAIYGLEKTPECTALVMELVEGDDLSQRIARLRATGASAGQAGMPLDEALPIAKQIAEALEAAHEQGIIHRDLKPANIKVRPDGTVKVLDFGLAKAMGPLEGDGFSRRQAEAEASALPTITTPAMPFDWRSGHPEQGRGVTQVGMILGTAAYMAPEQARGKAVDRRADIWAFGAVLFEMLAGRRPFDGEDTTEVLGAVVRLDPQWDALPTTTPARITQVLRACLQKDPKRRMGDMQSVRLALDGHFDTAAPPPIAAAPAPRPLWRHALVVATAMGVGVLLTVAAAWRLWPTVVPAPEVRLEIPTPGSLGPQNVALSPDGGSIVFTAFDNGTPRLWLRQLNQADAQPLKGTERGLKPFWSPDGRSIGFFEQQTNRLKRVDLDGGVTTLTEGVAGGARGSWNREGIILTPVPDGLARVPANGGPLEMVVKARISRNTNPVFLPDGQRFLCYLPGDKEGIYWGSLNGAPLTFLTAAESSGQVFQGRLFYINQGSLFARPLDLGRMELTGEPERIADETRAFALSDSGFIAYGATDGASLRQLRWWDRTGKSGNAVGEPSDSMVSPALSPDGRRVAVDRTIQDNRDVWIVDIIRGATARFTFDPKEDGYPVWSPDGTAIAFESARNDPFDIYLKPSDSAAAEKPLLELPGSQWPYDWSRDGKYLLYSNSIGVRDLFALPLGTAEQKPISIAATPFRETNGAFSPDGHWVTYQTNESGRDEIVVTSFPNTSGKWQVSTSGGIQPRWRADGKEIYFISPEREMMATAVRASGASFEADKPVALFQTRIAVLAGPGLDKHQYDVSKDGRFLINDAEDAAAIPTVTLILNWRPKSK